LEEEFMRDILVVEDIKKGYGKRGAKYEALKGVSFTVKEGEFIGIMGASGAGKSTLLNIISTIDIPTSGKVFIDGVDINTMNGNEIADFRRDHLGFVFQDFNLIKRLSIKENIEIPMLYRGFSIRDTKDKVIELLKKVNLESKINKYPTELSGGQQQRVSIARAILKDSPMLLLDEATASLDIENELYVKGAIANLIKDDKTIIMIAHNLSIIKNADNILVLDKGRIVEHGKHETLIKNKGKYYSMWNSETKI